MRCFIPCLALLVMMPGCIEFYSQGLGALAEGSEDSEGGAVDDLDPALESGTHGGLDSLGSGPKLESSEDSATSDSLGSSASDSGNSNDSTSGETDTDDSTSEDSADESGADDSESTNEDTDATSDDSGADEESTGSGDPSETTADDEGSDEDDESTDETGADEANDESDPSEDTTSEDDDGDDDTDADADDGDGDACQPTWCILDNPDEAVGGDKALGSYRHAIRMDFEQPRVIRRIELFFDDESSASLVTDIHTYKHMGPLGDLLGRAPLEPTDDPGWYASVFDPPVRVEAIEHWISWNAQLGMNLPAARRGTKQRQLSWNGPSNWISLNKYMIMRVECCELD